MNMSILADILCCLTLYYELNYYRVTNFCPEVLYTTSTAWYSGYVAHFLIMNDVCIAPKLPAPLQFYLMDIWWFFFIIMRSKLTLQPLGFYGTKWCIIQLYTPVATTVLGLPEVK